MLPTGPACFATVLNQLRGFGQGSMLLLVPICAYTIMHHVFAMQRQIFRQGLPFLILPIRV